MLKLLCTEALSLCFVSHTLLTIGIEQFIGREKLQIVSRAADDLRRTAAAETRKTIAAHFVR